MPVKIYNRTFKSFGSAVKFIEETLGISRERARNYVAAVDRKQNKPRDEKGKKGETTT